VSVMRKIIHCDADCFFVALEVRDDPDLRGLPVAVGGDPGRRGVISTCSYEARAFGVRSAMASAHAKRLCPQLIILSHSMAKYREASMAMRRIFSDYTDVIEPLSMDEAYLDVTATHHCLGSATLIAKDIRRRIYQDVGITVSAGVAVNKFLAPLLATKNTTIF
jgi:DNA polymerase IV